MWARPEMTITFRIEIMPGRSHEQRTFRIKTVFPNGSVVLHGLTGEHHQAVFEPVVLGLKSDK